MQDNVALISMQYAVVGEMVKRPACIGEILHKLSPEVFNGTEIKGLYEAICKLHLSGAPVDPISVLAAAGADYGNPLHDVMITNGENALYYCDQILAIIRLQKITQQGFALAAAESQEEADKHIDAINNLMVCVKGVDSITALDAAADFVRRKSTAEPPDYLEWNLKELDKSLHVSPGNFVVLGGYPSAGKTLLALQFALHIAKTKRVGFFSLETDKEEITDRIMTTLSKVNYERILENTLTQADWDALAAAGSAFSELKFEIIHATGWTCQDIRAETLSKRFEVIFVDYLQIVRTKAFNRYEAVTQISQDLRLLATGLGVTVVALAQLSRSEKIKGKALPPSMASFRESGQIEQDADLAMLLWASDANDNDSPRVLKVAKNKKGRRAKLLLDFDGATQSLVAHVPTKAEQYQKTTAEIEKINRSQKQHGDLADEPDYDQAEFPIIAGEEDLPF